MYSIHFARRISEVRLFAFFCRIIYVDTSMQHLFNSLLACRLNSVFNTLLACRLNIVTYVKYHTWYILLRHAKLCRLLFSMTKSNIYIGRSQRDIDEEQ